MKAINKVCPYLAAPYPRECKCLGEKCAVYDSDKIINGSGSFAEYYLEEFCSYSGKRQLIGGYTLEEAKETK